MREDRMRLNHVAMKLLRDGFEYARDCARPAEDFAVEIEYLMQAGLSCSDLRWLVCKGILVHLCEHTQMDSPRRVFSSPCQLSFSPSSCFVLTSQGYTRLDSRERHCESEGIRDFDPLELKPCSVDELPNLQPQALTPVWDRQVRELRLNGTVVKRFRVQSPNQETILSAFQEDDWAARIDDPLSCKPEIDPKRRLHDTIRNLNRNQLTNVLQFSGDGTGSGVLWKIRAS